MNEPYKVGKCTFWEAKCAFRFYKDYLDSEPVLQQLWISGDGTCKWENVETVVLQQCINPGAPVGLEE